MSNLVGSIWGLGLAIILSAIIHRKIKQKIEKEVKVINVIRPNEETDGGDEFEISGTKQDVADRVGRDKPKRKTKGRWRVSDKSSKTNGDDKSEFDEDSERIEPVRTAVPPFESLED